jgi:hypothetical protein
VERPYKHAFRDDSEARANKHSLSQLAPARLHGAAYLKSLKEEAQSERDQGSEHAKTQLMLRTTTSKVQGGSGQSPHQTDDNASVNSSVSGGFGDMDNIEFKPEVPNNKLKKERLEALLQATGAPSTSRPNSRSNSIKPQKRFSSLLKGEEG